METILDQIKNWLERGQSAGLATVISTWGSSPRQAGAWMAISDRSEISGSVSGGCVEGAVIDAALEVISTGIPTRLHFGVADSDAWQVGLSCGGEIDLYLRPFREPDLACWEQALSLERAFCSLLVLDGGETRSSSEWLVMEDGKILQDPSLLDPPEELVLAALQACQEGATGIRSFSSLDGGDAFLQVVSPPRTLVLVGGAHIAIPLASLAKTVGFAVVVVDPRRLFATQERFPDIKTLLPLWPEQAFQELRINSSTAVVTLTHDPKIDDPALLAALRSPAFYIGALGSRKTHQSRVDRLQQSGISLEMLARVHAPVGLDLGASSPEEIALAIMAEVVQAWHQR